MMEISIRDEEMRACVCVSEWMSGWVGGWVGE